MTSFLYIEGETVILILIEIFLITLPIFVFLMRKEFFLKSIPL